MAIISALFACKYLELDLETRDMKKLGVVIATFLLLALVIGIIGCKGEQITSTPARTPTVIQTSIATPSPSGSEIPLGNYISDSEPQAHKIVVSKNNTLSVNSTYEIQDYPYQAPGFPELGLHTYTYELTGSSIILQDVVSGRTITMSYRYLPAYNILVLGDESYTRE